MALKSFSDHLLFSTATLLTLSGNVPNEIKMNFLVSKTSKSVLDFLTE